MTCHQDHCDIFGLWRRLFGPGRSSEDFFVRHICADVVSLKPDLVQNVALVVDYGHSAVLNSNILFFLYPPYKTKQKEILRKNRDCH